MFYNAAHHALEWITVPVLMKFAEDFARAYALGTTLRGYRPRDIWAQSSIYIIPMVNPDGVDLVLNGLSPDNPYYTDLIRWNNGSTDFSTDWQANIRGVDLNHNYNAAWEASKEGEAALGITGPGPTRFSGAVPVSEPETQTTVGFTNSRDFRLVLAYHSQGEVIFWNFMDMAPPEARTIGEQLAQVSGYELAEATGIASYAGYKDWFTQDYRRPGYTVEVWARQEPPALIAVRPDLLRQPAAAADRRDHLICSPQQLPLSFRGSAATEESYHESSVGPPCLRIYLPAAAFCHSEECNDEESSPHSNIFRSNGAPHPKTLSRLGAKRQGIMSFVSFLSCMPPWVCLRVCLPAAAFCHSEECNDEESSPHSNMFSIPIEHRTPRVFPRDGASAASHVSFPSFLQEKKQGPGDSVPSGIERAAPFPSQRPFPASALSHGRTLSQCTPFLSPCAYPQFSSVYIIPYRLTRRCQG